ncbi:NUDIX hydrolase [Gimesia sp.]|uniref:NUDIX hydrolase n=1 Tax=Gimesia sp. TaxID=2024833 RepID=UPI003A932E55
MTDICIDLNEYRVNLRVAAIVRREEEVLLCRPPDDEDWWFLPGGRVRVNEDSLTAVQRELTEEIGPGFAVQRPVAVVENFFDLDNRRFHEICTFYEVAWHGTAIAATVEDVLEVFDWFSLSDLSDVVLKPELIKERILNPRAELELILNRENG